MSMKVLVVDDDADMRSIIVDALSAQGLECVPAANADEAVKRFLEGGIGMIILDIHMPGMSGSELHRVLSQEFGAGKRTSGFAVRKLPYILIVTGYATDEVRLKTQFGESVVGILYKPFNVQLLVDIVKDTLARAQADEKRKSTRRTPP